MSDFRKGDKVKVEGVIVGVGEQHLREYMTVMVRGGQELYLRPDYLDLVERPPAPPKVGDRLKSDRPSAIWSEGTIMGIAGRYWWVKWDGGGFTTMDSDNLGAQFVRIST